jgi:cytochrome c556
VRNIVLAVLAVAGLTAVAAAQNRPPSPAATIKMRQANYKQMGAAMRALNEQVRGSSPALPVIRTNSAVILRHAPQLLRWFPAGTGAEAGVRTRARPEIWSDRDGFTRAGAGLVVAARGLDAAARGGDMGAIRAAVPQLAHACSNCHDDYRAPEH